MIPTDKDIYIEEFSKLNRGAPLFDPGHGEEVQVGDVGYIDAHDGFFQKLYNIAHPPTNGGRDCPPPIQFKTISHPLQWGIVYVYLTCFILRTLPDL